MFYSDFSILGLVGIELLLLLLFFNSDWRQADWNERKWQLTTKDFVICMIILDNFLEIEENERERERVDWFL